MFSWLLREFFGILFVCVQRYCVQSMIPLLCDNEGAIKLVDNIINHSRTKHIDICHHFLRDHQYKGDITIQHVRTKF